MQLLQYDLRKYKKLETYQQDVIVYYAANINYRPISYEVNFAPTKDEDLRGYYTVKTDMLPYELWYSGTLFSKCTLLCH